MNYTVTEDISKATHWLAHKDSNSCVKEFIIPEKVYPLIKYDDGFNEEESFIKAEDGSLSMYFMCHKGDFIISNGQ